MTEYIEQEANLLNDAIQADDIGLCHKLVAQGVDVNKVGAGDSPALHRAVFYDRVEIVTLLLAAGGDINQVCDIGFRPLSWAIRRNVSRELLMLVLNAGAEVNYATLTGESPLSDAVQHGSMDVCKLLLAKGASSSYLQSKMSSSMLTPFQRVVKQGKLEHIALFARACDEDIDQVTVGGETLFELSKGDRQVHELLHALKAELAIEKTLAQPDDALSQVHSAPRASSPSL